MADGSEGEKKKSAIWLWHQRLGHVSFGYLKKLFPSLFVNSDISGFCCDICELAKSHCASFPLILNKSLLPFMVIHSNFGAHPNSQLLVAHVGLLLLLMIVPE